MNKILMHCLQNNQILLRRLLVLMLVLVAVPVFANTQVGATSESPDPIAVMKIAIEDVLAQLKNHEALYTADPEQLRSLVATSALPNFYIKRMAQLALAKHWRTANAQQRETYVSEFERYLIRSYTKTLFAYRNAKPEMLGRQGKNEKSADKTTLKIRVKSDRGETVMLFLRLELLDSHWKIVDINVEGISLVVTARGVFDEEINRIGLDAFLVNLTDKNNKAALNE
jgi:phospholipid transport system substrate-binding protein